MFAWFQSSLHSYPSLYQTNHPFVNKKWFLEVIPKAYELPEEQLRKRYIQGINPLFADAQVNSTYTTRKYIVDIASRLPVVLYEIDTTGSSKKY